MYLENSIFILIIAYVTLIILFEFVSNKVLSKYIIILVNVIFSGLLLFPEGSLDFYNEKNVLITLFLIGNTFFIYKSKKNSHIFNAQNLLALQFLLLNNMLLNALGLIIHIKIFSTSIKRNSNSILDIASCVFVLLLPLIQFVSVENVTVELLSESIILNKGLVGLIIFLLFYGPLRSLLLLEDELTVKGESFTDVWLWLGVFTSYFVWISRSIDINNYFTEGLLNFFWIMIIFLSSILILKIENTKNVRSAFLGVLVFNQIVSFFALTISTRTDLALYIINLVLLIFLLSRKSIEKPMLSKKSDIIDIIVVFLFLLSFPYTPWFNFKIDLISQVYKSSNSWNIVLLMLILGIRYRQNFILLLNYARPTYLKLFKPS